MSRMFDIIKEAQAKDIIPWPEILEAIPDASDTDIEMLMFFLPVSDIDISVAYNNYVDIYYALQDKELSLRAGIRYSIMALHLNVMSPSKEEIIKDNQ